MRKRDRYILRWALKGEGEGRGWNLVHPTGIIFIIGGSKKFAIRKAARMCRANWPDGNLAQLVVKTKRGTISFERTYGKDPKRTKG